MAVNPFVKARYARALVAYHQADAAFKNAGTPKSGADYDRFEKARLEFLAAARAKAADESALRGPEVGGSAR
ncbi:hypothetical protein D5S18_26105 [Nocardia panacis]|uniref:Uncharacterized protein n=1 Tax=Nocardia panacis TaxID=2340916 RepID=A0A3A4K0C1_9NOCA|nr:hypothetical protein [Nocardia panacis]RJO70683.1 hypothetical protein D5S18_26105 [Nocardia panacis]